MPDKSRAVPKELLERVAMVTNKRARFVLDRIVKNGVVTTAEINQAGYDHPPRAAQDAKDLGFRIKRVTVKHSNGRSIAAYVFDEGELDPSKAGRRALPKKERDAIIHTAGDKCHLCGAEHNLQVDHRIPYEIAGEGLAGEKAPFQVLCGSCNRKNPGPVSTAKTASNYANQIFAAIAIGLSRPPTVTLPCSTSGVQTLFG